jgi:hypothetical protein
MVSKGMGSNDQVWRFNTPEDGDYIAMVVTSGWDAYIAAFANCADPVGTCIAANDSQQNDFIEFSSQRGETVFLIVDGEDNIRNDDGNYEIRVFSK